jgi:hypothetical protein
MDWMPRPILGRGGWWVRQTCGKILPAHVFRNEEERWRRLNSRSILFRLVTPPLQPGSGGAISGTWCMVPKPFATGGNQSYPKFWVVTVGARYLGY